MTNRNKYNYLAMPIKDVMNDISEFVIPENREAIEYLWDMNILTTQTNNYDNQTSFICIGLLSPENEKLFWDIYNARIRKGGDGPVMGIIYGGRGIEIPMIPGTGNTFKYFKPYIDLLSYQDVQKDGYITIPEFFMNYTDCWTIINNPYYHPLQKPRVEDYEDTKDYFRAVDKYFESKTTKRRIKIFDESKVVKPLKEYLQETGFANCFDEEEGKIYYNERLLNGHLRYKRYQDFLHHSN